MQDQNLREHHPHRRIPAGIIASFSAVVLLAGSAAAFWTWTSITSKVSAPIATPPASTEITPTTIQPAPEATVSPPDSTAQAPTEQTGQVYWLKDTGTQLELVPRPVSIDPAASSGETLKVVFEELLQGPADATVASTIPPNTSLLNLDVQDDGVHVNLSREFTSGGGSASMTGRLAQIIYTASSLEPTANVWISVEGESLQVLGGEGLIVNQPMTRADFDANFAL